MSVQAIVSMTMRVASALRASVQVCRVMPPSVVAIALVITTMQKVAMVSVLSREVMAVLSRVAIVSVLSRVVMVVLSRVVMVSALNREVMVVPSRVVMVVPNRVVMVVPSRVATVVPSKVVMAVPSRVAMVSLMVQLLIRRVLVSILPTMIQMQSIV